MKRADISVVFDSYLRPFAGRVTYLQRRLKARLAAPLTLLSSRLSAHAWRER